MIIDDNENNISYFVLKDSKGNEVHEIEVYLYANIENYHCESDGRLSKYTISPKLPSGLSLSYDGILSGLTNKPLNNTVFTITATGYDTYSLNFTMRVVPCIYGPSTKIELNGDANITLIHDSTVIYDEFVSIRIGLCIPLTDYTYEVICTRLSRDYDCMIAITSENNHHYKLITADLDKKQTGILIMIETAPPKLSILPFQAVPNSLFHLHYDCEGIQYVTQVIPPIGEISVEYHEASIQFQNVPSGIHHLQLVSNNSMGIGTVNFTLAVNTCPDGMTKLDFSRERSDYNNERLEIFDPSNTLVYSTSLRMDTVPQAFFCLEEGKPYHFHMYGLKNSGWIERFPLRIFNSKGDVAHFFMHGNLKESWRHFYFNTLIPYNSSFAFSKQTPSSNWLSKKFKEKWQEGHSASFGNFDSSNHLYLRHTFNIDDLIHYSHFFIDLQYANQVTVYMNEVPLIQTQQPQEISNHRYHLPLSYLQQGTNILAIDIFNTNSSSILAPIVFDITLFMSTSQSFELSTGGSVSSIQPFNDPNHPVEYAFDSNEKTFWNVTGYPASLDYHFSYHEKRCINTILLHQSLYDTPSTFRIEGIEDDNSTTVLYSLSSSIFMTEHSYDLIQFDNTHFYSTYRIVFENSVHSIPMGLSIIKLMYTIPLSCQKRLGISSTALHTSVYKNCKFYQVGKKHIECIEQDNQAFWNDDTSACRSHFPHKPNSFIDSTIMIEGLNIDNFETIKEKLIEIITKHIIVLEEEINFVMLRDISTENAYITEITMRFTVDYRVGDYVHFRLIESFIPSFSQYIQSINPKYSGSFIGEPKLYNPVNWVIVTLVCLLILALLILVIIYVIVRRKPSRSTRKLRKEEKRELLDNYAYIVCF